MTDPILRHAHDALTGERGEYVRNCLARVREALATSSAQDECLEVLISFFHIDPLDRPELVPLLDEAIDVVASIGEPMIPRLLDIFDGADLKAQMAAGHALGRIGEPAIRHLLADWSEAKSDTRRALVLYALGKIQAPAIVAAVPLAVEAAKSPDLELRDTAVRALGKFAESIPPGKLTPAMVDSVVTVLLDHAADPMPHVRAKAVRSLGKLARFGHLSPTMRATLREMFEQIVGKTQNWDHAYIVRHEAEEALQHLKT
ncbi:MAG: HEAT repeat domain-containing protein [Thermoanaerobaculia bacterium]